MAHLNNPNDPNSPNYNPEEQRRMNELEHRRTLDERASGGWWGWWWVWIVIFFFFAFWFVGWGWGSYGGWWWGRPATVGVQPATGENPTAQSNNGGVNGTYNAHGSNATGMNQNNGAMMALLEAQNKRQYVDQPVVMNSVIVQKRVGDNAFWVGTNNSTAPLLVVVNANGNNGNATNSNVNNGGNNAGSNIQQGEEVDVTGTVRSAPGAAQASKDWNLTRAGAERLQREGAFVEASGVQIVNR